MPPSRPPVASPAPPPALFGVAGAAALYVGDVDARLTPQARRGAPLS